MKNPLVLIASIMFLTGMPLFCLEGKSADRIFAEANTAFLGRADHAKALESLEAYRGIYKNNPDNFDAAWRLSMACYFVAFNALKDNEAKKRLFAEGRDAGLEAVERSPGSAEAHFWTAVNMALYGQTAGIFKMLFTLNTVRSHLQKSLEIDPNYAYGGAFRILGKIDESLPGILGGNKSLARVNYEKAIASAPGEPLNYYFLAKLVLDEYKDKALALEIAYKGLSISSIETYRVESLDALRELGNLVKTCSAKREKP